MRSIGCRFERRADVGQRTAHDPLFRLAGMGDDGDGAVGAIERQQRLDDMIERVDGEMDGERCARRGEGLQLLAFRHARGAPGHARQHHALRHFRHGELAPERGGGGGEGGHARRQRVRDAVGVEPPHLLGHGAEHRKIARVKPRHVEARRVRGDVFRLDLVERHRRGIDQARALQGSRRAAPATRWSPHRGRPGSARGCRARAP